MDYKKPKQYLKEIALIVMFFLLIIGGKQIVKADKVVIETRLAEVETFVATPSDMGWKKEGGTWYYYKNNIRCYGWLSYNGKWYYLDRTKEGAMASNKVMQIGDSLYCFQSNGTMGVGWVKLNNRWYYGQSSGKLTLGWLKSKGKWYYLDDNTAEMLVDKIITNKNKKYYVDINGVMKTGWVKVKSVWYYADAGGAFRKEFLTLGSKTYYLQPDTYQMAVGWLNIDGEYYFFDTSGAMQTGWLKRGSTWYYLLESGKMAIGWQKVNQTWYYLKLSGAMTTGWYQVDNKWYYFKDNGAMVKGWQTIGGQKYYFEDSGRMHEGWLSSKNKWYYFKEGGAMATGWISLKGQWYYLKSDGVMSTGWEKVNGKWYYLSSNGQMHIGWLKLNGKWYFLHSNGSMAIGWIKDKGYQYYMNSDGSMAVSTYINGKYYVDASGRYQPNVTPQAAVGSKTIKGLLLNAVQPIGKSLYIYGGGHDTADATRIGINPNWVSWYNKHDSSYDPKEHQYKYGYGLDCSGYIGWTIYNTINTKSGGQSVTTTSTGGPKYYANKGWGTYSWVNQTVPKFRAGDIVSIEGHTWFVVGQCEDGSVVITHATPKYTQMASTVDRNGNYNSQARKLVQKYMPFYYSNAYNKFGNKISTVSKIYLTNVNRFEWKTQGGILSDPHGYKNKSAEEILKDMFST